MVEHRPDISSITTGAELQRWYWLKAELLAHAKALNLPTSGSKQALTDRIAHFLDTGEVLPPVRPPAQAGFNWARGTITATTRIDAGYTNGPNVRQFFLAKIGSRFRFNIAFMDWMKANTGKTMADAVAAWLTIEADRKAGIQQAIPASNQYNRYTRDFFAANPDASLADARQCWAYKRARPGHNRYEPQDLMALTTQNPDAGPQ